MEDPTENARRAMVEEINSEPGSRADLEKVYGQVWDTEELMRDFKVHGFLAPFVMVERLADHKDGLMMFQHLPRFYFGFEEE